MKKREMRALLIFAGFLGIMVAFALWTTQQLRIAVFLTVYAGLLAQMGMFFSTSFCCGWVEGWMLEKVDVTAEDLYAYARTCSGKHRVRKIYRWLERKATDKEAFRRRYQIYSLVTLPGPVCGMAVFLLWLKEPLRIWAIPVMMLLIGYCAAMVLAGRKWKKRR